MSSTLRTLFESLQRRMRPEDVAELVLTELGPELTRSQTHLLMKAASGSLKRGVHQLTSMAQDFERPAPPMRKVRKAVELFTHAPVLSDEDATDVEKVSAFVARLGAEIRKQFQKSDFAGDRLNKEARLSAGLEISRRRYNKLFRFLARFEEKLETYRMEQRKYEATRIAKSSLATRLSWADFSKSRDAACFIAYFTARRNRRSVFTNTGQDRALDEIADMLLTRFKQNPCTEGWRAIAHVLPDVDVVRHLSDADKMELFVTWLAVLHDLADLLRRTWERSLFDRSTMVVQRGDDSSTWNATAGAWNAARQGWLGLAHALGMHDTVDMMCLGKVMRLMASDVVRWHARSGGDLEPDTLIWAELPPPWEVLTGRQRCTRSYVERVCRKHGVDPEQKGWTSHPGQRQAVPFSPTPELVHGVVVSHPQLASALKKAGWFSGKPGKGLDDDVGPFMVRRDEQGAVVGVTAVEVEEPRL
ncbi:hypothetical protein MFUL124B02_02495 [Myxococcus fulvus 124B02]|nr:hypothetical protein MFUL124B02_02495 [Myxococcus fulvus 124B02]